MHESVAALYRALSVAALAHGDESGSEYEVGDLQSLLIACLDIMTPDQVAAMMRHDQVVALLEVPEFEGIAFTPPA